MSHRWLPPEWAPQQAMLLVWPRDGGDWGRYLAEARTAIADLTHTLLDFQPVVLAVHDAAARASAQAHPAFEGARLDRLTIVTVANDDIWARDTGPITVFDTDARRFLDFRFDGWGGQFAAGHDDRLTAALHAAGALGHGVLERHEFTLEGGSIEANGAGAVLTTERCLIGGRRNAGLDRDRASDWLGETLGAARVHWLTAGNLIGDDTDGHVDTLARFVAADTIVYQGCDDPDDAHHASLTTMAAELAALRDRNDRAYRLVELPLPAPIHDADDGHRLPAGYANFVIANGCIVLPVFDDPTDEIAAARLGALFPDRALRRVDARALIRQHGSLHCAVMQIPAEPAHG